MQQRTGGRIRWYSSAETDDDTDRLSSLDDPSGLQIYPAYKSGTNLAIDASPALLLRLLSQIFQNDATHVDARVDSRAQQEDASQLAMQKNYVGRRDALEYLISA